MKKLLKFIWRQKIYFSLDVFFEILKRYCKVVILGTWSIPGYAHPKWYQFVKTFHVYLQAKNQLYPSRFSGDILKTLKLLILGILGRPFYTHPKLYYQLVEKLEFICMPKINFITHFHFFLEILYSKESCNLIGWQHFGS